MSGETVRELEVRWLDEHRGPDNVPWSVRAMWFLCSAEMRLKATGHIGKQSRVATGAKGTPADVALALDALWNLGGVARSLLDERPDTDDPMDPATPHVVEEEG